MSRWLVNKSAACRWFGVNASTLDRWLQLGAPFVQRGAQGRPWVLDVRELLRWRYQPKPPPEPFDPDTADPKARKDWFDSEHVRRRLADRDAALIPAQDVRDGVAALVAVVSDVLAALPARLEADAGLSGPALDRARRAMDAALVELQTTAATLPRP